MDSTSPAEAEAREETKEAVKVELQSLTVITAARTELTRNAPWRIIQRQNATEVRAKILLGFAMTLPRLILKKGQNNKRPTASPRVGPLIECVPCWERKLRSF